MGKQYPTHLWVTDVKFAIYMCAGRGAFADGDERGEAVEIDTDNNALLGLPLGFVGA